MSARGDGGDGNARLLAMPEVIHCVLLCTLEVSEVFEVRDVRDVQEVRELREVREVAGVREVREVMRCGLLRMRDDVKNGLSLGVSKFQLWQLSHYSRLPPGSRMRKTEIDANSF